MSSPWFQVIDRPGVVEDLAIFMIFWELLLFIDCFKFFWKQKIVSLFSRSGVKKKRHLEVTAFIYLLHLINFRMENLSIIFHEKCLARTNLNKISNFKRLNWRKISVTKLMSLKIFSKYFSIFIDNIKSVEKQ